MLWPIFHPFEPFKPSKILELKASSNSTELRDEEREREKLEASKIQFHFFSQSTSDWLDRIASRHKRIAKPAVDAAAICSPIEISSIWSGKC